MSIFEVLKPIKMTSPTTALKIESFVDTKLLPGLKELYGGLKKGDLFILEIESNRTVYFGQPVPLISVLLCHSKVGVS